MSTKEKPAAAAGWQTKSDSQKDFEEGFINSTRGFLLPREYNNTLDKSVNCVHGFDGKKFFTADYVRGKTFYKEVTNNQTLRRPPTIAIQSTVLRKLENMGIDGVFVRNLDTKEVFYTPLSQFHKKGITINRGHGRQIALPLQYWVCAKER